MKSIASLTMLLLAGAVSAPAGAQEGMPATSADGLTRRENAGVYVSYVREGADIGEYERILVGPVTVTFRKDFESTAAPGTNRRVSESDLQGIRERLGTLVRDEVIRELGANGYRFADAPSANVMRLNLRVADLYVTMPQQRHGPDEVMAFTAGEMVLVAEIADSVSGEVAARIYDRASAKETHHMRRIHRSENAEEARRIAQYWAELVREKIDAARAKSD